MELVLEQSDLSKTVLGLTRIIMENIILLSTRPTLRLITPLTCISTRFSSYVKLLCNKLDVMQSSEPTTDGQITTSVLVSNFPRNSSSSHSVRGSRRMINEARGEGKDRTATVRSMSRWSPTCKTRAQYFHRLCSLIESRMPGLID